MRKQAFRKKKSCKFPPASRWATYLLLIPVFIIMAVIGIFFFTAFLALFAVAAAGLGFRLWWLRRKLRKSTEAEEGEYLVIEDAEIVEERAASADDVNATKKRMSSILGTEKSPKKYERNMSGNISWNMS